LLVFFAFYLNLTILFIAEQLRYKTWLWWSRFALVMTLLQILTAIYLVFNVVKYISHDGTSSECQPGKLT
jgi:hypothetical protein